MSDDSPSVSIPEDNNEDEVGTVSIYFDKIGHNDLEKIADMYGCNGIADLVSMLIESNCFEISTMTSTKRREIQLMRRFKTYINNEIDVPTIFDDKIKFGLGSINMEVQPEITYRSAKVLTKIKKGTNSSKSFSGRLVVLKGVHDILSNGKYDNYSLIEGNWIDKWNDISSSIKMVDLRFESFVRNYFIINSTTTIKKLESYPGLARDLAMYYREEFKMVPSGREGKKVYKDIKDEIGDEYINEMERILEEKTEVNLGE